MTVRSARRTVCAALLALSTVVPGASIAGAQTYDNPNLPRSPYALPQPTYREPDVEELADGNGLTHFSGQWRHWGDKRNGGELLYDLLGGPEVGPRVGLAPRCRQHPEEC
jgi:hypothetical protein